MLLVECYIDNSSARSLINAKPPSNATEVSRGFSFASSSAQRSGLRVPQPLAFDTFQRAPWIMIHAHGPDCMRKKPQLHNGPPYASSSPVWHPFQLIQSRAGPALRTICRLPRTAASCCISALTRPAFTFRYPAYAYCCRPEA